MPLAIVITGTIIDHQEQLSTILIATIIFVHHIINHTINNYY